MTCAPLHSHAPRRGHRRRALYARRFTCRKRWPRFGTRRDALIFVAAPAGWIRRRRSWMPQRRSFSRRSSPIQRSAATTEVDPRSDRAVVAALVAATGIEVHGEGNGGPAVGLCGGCGYWTPRRHNNSRRRIAAGCDPVGPAARWFRGCYLGCHSPTNAIPPWRVVR